MSSYFTDDWRQAAAAAIKQAAMTATSDSDVEKAFSDQACGFVENKVGDLMKEEHRIGFEIVKKNDENTRMVGVFAFKVDKNLIFAPVFFINGEIKGPLLYRCDTKTFVPANKEWASYLVESMDAKEGKGRSKTRRSDSPPLVQMRRIAFLPSSMAKGASDGGTINVQNEPAVIRSYKLKETGEPGVYEVDMPGPCPDGHVANTSSNSALCVCTCDDGTIHVKTDKEDDMLTKKQAQAILDGGEVVLEYGDDKYRLSGDVAGEIKQAFLTNVPDRTGEWIANMANAIGGWEKSSSGLLKELFDEVDYGKPAVEAVVKAACSSEKVMSHMVSLYGDPENWIPKTFRKSASVEDPCGPLSMVMDPSLLAKESAEIKKEYFRDGFFILDKRPEESLSVVYHESPVNITSPDVAGIYSVVGEDGKFEDDVIVLREYEGPLPVSDDQDRIARPIDDRISQQKQSYICIKDGKACSAKALLGKLTGTLDQVNGSTVKAKNVYIFVVGGKAIGPVAVKEVSEADGVQYIKAWCREADGMEFGSRLSVRTWPGLRRFVVNRDRDKSDIKSGVFGRDALIIRLDSETRSTKYTLYSIWDDGYGEIFVPLLDSIHTGSSVHRYLYEADGLSRVAVERMMDGKYRFKDITGGKNDMAGSMPKSAALIKLTRDFGIHGPEAYGIINKADSEGVAEFYLAPTEKVASRLHVVEQPDFTEDFDSEFGIPVTENRAYRLAVRGDQEFERPSAVGDAMNPMSPTGLPEFTVATTNPDDLRALADTMNLPHVFEHGVVGTLADTFNAMSLVTKYIPKIEDGVDALGRIKFLIHWCPNDFERAYGEDDMTNLEAEVDSNFISQGSLLLKLLKKSNKLKRGDGTQEGEKKENH